MGEYRKLVCLANSKRDGGRCVAGRLVTDQGFGPWIRLVADEAGGPVPTSYYWQFLPSHIVEVPVASHAPFRHHTENHVIASGDWRRAGYMTCEELGKLVESPEGPLWLNGDSSSGGYNDRVPEECLRGLSRSLYLVRPENVELQATYEQLRGWSKQRIRASFDLCGEHYKLVVTDPQIRKQDWEAGSVYSMDDALLCISLGEPFHGYAYKLAAAVITSQSVTQALGTKEFVDRLRLEFAALLRDESSRES